MLLDDPIAEIKFRKGSSNVLVKTTLDAEPNEHNFLQKSFTQKEDWAEMPKSKESHWGISEAKKAKIIDALTGDVLIQQRQWWENLPVNNSSADLGVSREKGELLKN